MKLETSPKVTKSKRSLHWCRSISKTISVHVLLQYQSKSYYIIGQDVYYSIGRFITLSGSYYITGRFLLHYRAFITLSVGTGVFTKARAGPVISSDNLNKKAIHTWLIASVYVCTVTFINCNQMFLYSSSWGLFQTKPTNKITIKKQQ